MPKKFTNDYVKKLLLRDNYILLSPYIGYNEKFRVKCPNGHIYFTTLASWKKGVRCNVCKGRENITYETVKNSFEAEGYKLLTNIYKNNRQKLWFICPNGHYGYILWVNWRKGHRCFKCGRIKSANKQRLSVDFIKKEFSKEGYKILSDDYVNRNSKLKFKCPNGHIHYITWREWKNDKRCAMCAGNAKLAYNRVVEEFDKEGYTLLSDTYINSYTKLKYKCKNGHISYISWDKWKQGRRCPVCANLKRFGSGNPMWKGGSSSDPYCDLWRDKDFKEYIKWRDRYVCNNIGCVNTTDLVVHHIDYNKKNCDQTNLITLCRSCNSKVNVNRGWYKELFRRILSLRLGFDYE